MNKIYKTKYDVTTGSCVVVSEVSRSRKKTSVKNLISAYAGAICLFAMPMGAYAAAVSKTDIDAVGGVITVTEAEVGQVGSVVLPDGGAPTSSGKGAIDVRTAGSANNIVIEGGVASIITQGATSTTGKRSYGIYAEVGAGGSGDVTIGSALKPVSGSIKTLDTNSASFSYGIAVNNAGSGAVRIYSSANIDTYGRGSRGIWVDKVTAGATGDIVIENSGNITLYSSDNPYASIQVEDKGSGNIYIANSGDLIGQNISGNKNSLYARKYASATGNINIGYAGDGALKAVTGTLSALGDGWQIYGWHQGEGNINIQVGDATLKNGTSTATTDSTIFAHYDPGAGVGNKQSDIFVNVGNATIETIGAGGSAGIEAKHDGSLGNITMSSKANVVAHGADTHGIWARYGTSNIQNGAVHLTSTGNVTTYGDQSKGVYAQVSTPNATADVQVRVSGQVATHGHITSQAVFAENNGNGDVLVVADRANLQTHGLGFANLGIEAKATDGNASIVFSNSHVKIGASISGALSAYQDFAGGLATATARVEIYNSVVDASQSLNVPAVSAFAQGGGYIYIDANTQVHGGRRDGIFSAPAIGIGGADQRLDNYGTVDAMSDFAITGTAFYGGPGDRLVINNYGTMTGWVFMGAEDTTFNNYSSNSWNIRHFADMDGDGVRDKKFVAISEFDMGNDTVMNSATGTIRLLGVSGESSTDTMGEYVPVGALSSSQTGIVQGQLVNLETFDNAGVIDLTDNGLAGDVLVITGAAAATGASGGGQYISNGGSIKLDTLMNQGGAASVSDMVVLDDVVLGSGASKLLITPQAGSMGGVTTGDGIKVLEVLGTQDAGSFTLGAPVTYGAYEYQLYQGGAGGANNWYLRNTLRGVALTNPNVGGYLANQYAAGKMFYQNILDRQNSIYNTDKTVWGRTNFSQVKAEMLDGTQDAKVRTTLIQLGADLYQKDDWYAGVYGGYGKADIENESKQTGSKTEGDVTGYHIGVYGSWIPETARSPYVDVWGYYAWFDNELSGAAQQHKKAAYDSIGYALSAEVGYKLPLATQMLDRSWALKPHAQLTYANVDADDFYDVNNTYYAGNKASGIQTRLGARLSGEVQEGRAGVSPYVELNWLHNARDNAINVSGSKQNSDVGKNVAEIKLGFHGKPNEQLSIWGHVGAQGGSDAYKGYEMQVGLDWRW